MNTDIFEFKRPGVAVDVILFGILDKNLKVGLIQREEEPHLNKYALPGRFVRYEEPIEDTAKMALKLKGGINPEVVFSEQLYTFGQDLKRDTRIRTISIVYYGLIDSQKIDFQSGNKFKWYSVYDLPQLAFDHNAIIRYALERLCKKIKEWEDVAFQLMPKEFTLTELQNTYEIILNEKLDKRNFRKKILEQNILKELKKKKMEGVHRPAGLFSFIRQR